MPVKIVLDPGHNPQGFNAGAEGYGYQEQDIVYAVAQDLAALLRRDDRFSVRVTRNTPTEILGTSNASSLQRRVQIANDWGADYFISIHANASPNPQANGTQVLTYRESGPAYEMGKDILASIVAGMNMKDLGMLARPDLYVLRRTAMPAMLIELGFITNLEDVTKMANDPRGFADAIYRGILDYLNY